MKASVTFRRPGEKQAKRRTTVYFSAEIARKLAAYCSEHSANMSDVVNTAVEKFLAK